MKKKYIIAIDGPAASGKSTTAKLLAKKLKYIYIDTGTMYRACALDALQKKIKLNDQETLKKMLVKIDIQIKYSEKENRIFLNGKDVSKRIREADITKLSSEIAVNRIVRERMVELQRKIGENGGVIMDGRDIGSVVFPDANFKFYMDADVKTRAYRRWIEAKEKGEELVLEEVEKELIWRDKNDSTRKIAPLMKVHDAITVNTSKMSIPEQVSFLMEIIKNEK